MAGPYQGNPRALGFFGSILGAAFQGATTSEVWQAMREASTATGIPLEGVTIQDVNQMRAIAGQNVSAFNALAASNPANVISSEMITIGPNTATGPSTGMPNSYALRVAYSGVSETGEDISGWTTIYITQPLESMTVEDLTNLAQTEATAQVQAYQGGIPGGTLLDVSSLSIFQV